MFKLADGRQNVYQWDINVKLLLDESNKSADEVHFSARFSRVSLSVEVVHTVDSSYVTIPNILLQKPNDIIAYSYITNADGSYTKYDTIIPVIARPKPSGYVYEETEILTWKSLDERITELEKGGTGGSSVTVDDTLTISGAAADPDFNGIAHIYSYYAPQNCYIRNCRMEDNNATAIQPNAGENWLISDCIFHNNGFRDPASHIDWEDGRNHNKGHILRNCKFSGGGTVMATGADGLVIHNNEFDETRLYIGDEVQNSRVWLNTFRGGKNEIYTKTDMVFSQNYAADGATFTVAEQGDGVDFAVRQAHNETEE